MNCTGFGRNQFSYHPKYYPKILLRNWEKHEKDVPSNRWTGMGYESDMSGIWTQAVTATPTLWIPSCRIMGPHDANVRVGRQNTWHRHAHNTMLLIRSHVWYTASAFCGSCGHNITSGEHQAMQIAGLHEAGIRCYEQLRRIHRVQTEIDIGMLLNCIITLLTMGEEISVNTLFNTFLTLISISDLLTYLIVLLGWHSLLVNK